MRVIACALALLLALIAFAGWALVSASQPDPTPAPAEAKPTVRDRPADGHLVIVEGGESWVEYPDGTREHLTGPDEGAY